MQKIVKTLCGMLMLSLMLLVVEGCQPKAEMKVKVAGLADKSSQSDKTNGSPTDSSTIHPTVLSVTSPSANKKFTSVGDIVIINVKFSSDVGVENGSDIVLELTLGSVPRSASYTAGSGSSTLVFKYTVLANDYTTDLQYTGANALQPGAKGMIADVNENGADLTLPAISSANSLASQKISIDTRSGLTELFDTKIAFERKYYQTMSIKRLVANPEQVDIDAAATDISLGLNGTSLSCSVTNPYSTPEIPAANAMAGLLFDDQGAIDALLSNITYGTPTTLNIKYAVGGTNKADSKDTITVEDFYISDVVVTGFADGTMQKGGFIGWVSPMHVAGSGPNTSYNADDASMLTSNLNDILLQ